MITIKLYDDDNKGGSRGAEDLILPGTGGAGSRPSIRGLNVAVSIKDLSGLKVLNMSDTSSFF